MIEALHVTHSFSQGEGEDALPVLSDVSVTIGTGDWRTNATVLVSVFDHVLIGPMGESDQSFDAMIFATSPPPARKA